MHRANRTNKTSALIGLAAMLFSSSILAEGPLRLNFGVYSSNKPSAMVKIFKPALNELEDRMSAKLNREVDIRMQIAKEYDQGITDLTEGRVDFSRFGPASYIEAKRMNKDLRIVATENKNGSKVFYGIIATSSESAISDISQLKGKSFAFGDEGSTIGRFLSQLYLEQNGIRAADLSEYEYLGRHDKVGTSVGAGDFVAGALNESTFKKLVDKGEQIKELARFPNVTKPWIARSGLDPKIFEALKASLLEITQEQALKGLKIDGFLEGSDEDYQVIRTAMENNYVFFSDPVPTETSAPASSTVVSDAYSGGKPMHNEQPQAATAVSVANTTPQLMLAPTAHASANNYNNTAGNSITIQIELPHSMLSTGQQGNGPNNLTINLSFSDPVSPSKSVTAAAEGL